MEDPAHYHAGNVPAPAPVMSEQINELAQALANAQAAMKPASKDATNPHFGSRYSSLAEVWDAIREPLSVNGLAVVQLPSSGADSVAVATTLLHASGQWMRSTVAVPLRPEFSKRGTELPPGPQQVGSAITYGRRYGLCAMVGVASADEDDDGTAAQGAHVDRAGVEDHPQAEETEEERKARKEKYLRDLAAKKGIPPAKLAEMRQERQPAKADPEPSDAAEPDPVKDAPGADATAFNSRLYDACETAGITIEELTADLKTKGILKGAMTVDNLGAPIVDALLDGKDKASGKKNWDIVVSRIKENRK